MISRNSLFEVDPDLGQLKIDKLVLWLHEIFYQSLIQALSK